MSMIVFRHEVLTEFSRETLEFTVREKMGEEVIADFGLGIVDYLRDRAVFMEARTIERSSIALFFRSTRRLCYINPASTVSSIQYMDSAHSSSMRIILATKSAGDLARQTAR